jgi:hypothetical protein
MDKEGPVTMEDAAGFFANVFGGERFVDYVRFPLRVKYHIFPVDIEAHLDWRNLHHERFDFCRHKYDDRRRKGRFGERNEQQ